MPSNQSFLPPAPPSEVDPDALHTNIFCPPPYTDANHDMPEGWLQLEQKDPETATDRGRTSKRGSTWSPKRATKPRSSPNRRTTKPPESSIYPPTPVVGSSLSRSRPALAMTRLTSGTPRTIRNDGKGCRWR